MVFASGLSLVLNKEGLFVFVCGICESVAMRCDATVTAREVAFCRGHGGPGKVGGGMKMHEYSTNALSKNIC